MIYQQNRRQQSNGNDLKAVELFFFDMDGTLYLGERIIGGAREFISKIKKNGKRTVFLSNNSSKNRKDYFSKLTKMGFECKIEDIFTSLNATILKMKQENVKSIYPLGTKSFEEELLENGFVFSKENPDVVLLGFDKTLTYEKIDNAYQLLIKGTRYIATHPDITCPTETGYIPDIGGFISMFEKLTSRTPEIVGKPNVGMVSSIISHFSLKPSDCAMVGDRLYTDMRMALDASLKSILVLSGETKHDDYVKSGLDVDIEADSVNDLIDLI
ncbi:TPA: HAD family hydrolase [candidate division WOR-3 bacterium]|uniref:HAD family hydrolase n=1 Tax=candidate division WOR-3 bacterium TaxID=2052148 RepID=A0A350HC16_UNCW3|nr:HAD family hydrolase [candidate division WOR-3 bacterium]